MSHLCTCAWHGYTQGQGRWGGSKTETIQVNGIEFDIGAGDYDCSSSVITCWDKTLKYFYGIELDCTYTGNMRTGFLKTGLFEWYPMGSGFIAQPGDIYLNEVNHTAMCISDAPDLLGEFVLNEFGDITGGEVGDQTDNESQIINYYNFPWDGILHYKGQEEFEEDNMRPEDVWEYSYENSAPKGNMYNCALDTHDMVASLTKTDMSDVESETGEHVNTGVDLVKRVAYMEAYIKKIMRKLEID